MTRAQALCAVLLRGLAKPAELAPLRGEPWFGRDCRDVLCAVDALREVGLQVDRKSVAMVYIARGFSVRESVERVRELWGLWYGGTSGRHVRRAPWPGVWQSWAAAGRLTPACDLGERWAFPDRLPWAASRLRELAAERRATA